MKNTSAGFTLVELIVAMGLFAFVMTLVSSAYFVIIGVDSQTQGIATGVDNVSFALETMSRNIRTGVGYGCGLARTDCPGGDSVFSFTSSGGKSVEYARSNAQGVCGTSGSTVGNGCIIATVDGVTSPLTDPAVDITSLEFIAVGTTAGDAEQPYVTVLVSGSISSGSGGKTEDFSLETSATMRGTDL